MYPFKILNKTKYSLYFLNAFIENICIYIMPIIISICLTTPFTLNKFKILIILTITLKTLEIIFNSIWNIKAVYFLEETKKDLQLAYFRRICDMNVTKINNTHTGFLKKQIDIVSDETANLLNEFMTTINGFVIAISIFLIQVFTQSKLVFVICIVFIIFIVIYNIIITKFNVLAQEDYNNKNAKYNATNVDFIENVKVVKNYDGLHFATKRINKEFDIVRNPLKKVNIFGSLRFDGTSALIFIMYAILLISLFVQMQNGENVFSYVVFYTTMFTGLNTELRGVGYLFLHLNKFKSANNQIEKVLTKEEKQPKFKDFNSITLKDIEFKYNKKSKNVINIPYFSINKKDKLSIMGESGQGKSTFLNLFCRFYKIDNSKYLINGKESNKAPDIAYISQETDLFDLSIRDNLLLGKNISVKKLNEYLEDAGLLSWINSLEHGLDTIVGEKGIRLSTGQKQRLNIIRGILLDKEIYILDEPTSNLDVLSEEKIYDMINKYLNDKTLIIVTHRPKLRDICNKHYYFKDKEMILED